MTIDPAANERIAFLARVVQKECEYLAQTDALLFAQAFTAERARQLPHTPELAERVDAFVGRFGRLQDSLGDKFLPQLLAALGERTGAVVDNLDRAERLGWVESVDQWMDLRRLRNQMVHEYVEDPLVLATALSTAHVFVPSMLKVAQALLKAAAARGLTALQ